MVKIRSPREITDQLDRWVEQGRRLLPLTRGGDGRKRVKPRKPRKPRPLSKTFQHTPTIPTMPGPTGEAVRWRPTPKIESEPIMRETKRQQNIRLFEERQQAQPEFTRELRAALDLQPDPENAMLELFEVAEANQDQELENALAQISATRPRQFSQQFSRFNLAPAPKKKRKVSAYSKRFGIELKKLKKLHPRTKIQNLMKKAHRRTRAAMKKK